MNSKLRLLIHYREPFIELSLNMIVGFSTLIIRKNDQSYALHVCIANSQKNRPIVSYKTSVPV